MRRWLGTLVLLAILGFLGFHAFRESAGGALSMDPFTIEPDDRANVIIDESWAKDRIHAIAEGVEAPYFDALGHKADSAGWPSPRAPEWWNGIPRTGESLYRAFVVNPTSVESKQLLRNSVLNPMDMQIDRGIAESFGAYFEVQCRRISQARSLLEEGRMHLVKSLLAQGQLKPVSVDAMKGRSFRLNASTTVSGDELIEAARRSLGDNANSESLAMTALSMAGLFDSGDTFTFANNQSYLLPFERVEQGIPTVVAIERSVTLEFVAETHFWFAALGVLPNADELLNSVAPRIMENPR